jgi:predicted RNA-binding protein Jag
VDAGHDENEWPGIFISTTGLVFLGTPFRGAEGMSQVEMLAAARREYQEDEVQTDVLKILEPGNEFLQEVVDQFGKTRMQANKAQVACFYELKSSNVGKIVGKEDRTVGLQMTVHITKADCFWRDSW